MKSGKQRRKDIKVKRLERVARLRELRAYSLRNALPCGALATERSALACCNTDGFWPSFYVEQAFVCGDCGAGEVWTAKQQKWWYEMAKGSIYSHAVRCRACRAQARLRVEEARRVSREGLARKNLLKEQKELQ